MTILPNPFLPDRDDQIARMQALLSGAFARAETEDQFKAIIKIEAEYLAPLLTQRVAA